MYEVVIRAMDENYSTDYSVPATVVRRFWSKRLAKRWAYYHLERPAALSNMSQDEYRKTRVDVREVGAR